ncbi:ImmA/IrrE family metallo-endopeptidase [Sporomusa aerivorans]|uniref:ImmA/IrrE family metallo-endopeptidase n=1 Tax=Sporomusa aerivorans TaxID=204936 RepID=UPI00352A9D4F
MADRFWTKAILYSNVDKLLRDLNITHANYPLSSIDIAYTHCQNLTLEVIDFKTMQICGILSKGIKGTSIALNAQRDQFMQNFDCMHELIHYSFHKGSAFHCICSEKASINQDKIQEWQANEGAAQALVPYQLFIPEYVSLSRKYARDLWSLYSISSTLATMFNVTSKVIQNRINNLEYEIYQYMCGKPVTEIHIVSKKKAREYELDNYIAHYSYCTNCLGIVNEKQRFCHICGNDLMEISPDGWSYTILKGVGFMIYDEIILDAKSKAVVCPRCNNEDIHPEGSFCKICGTNLINFCAGYWDRDEHNEEYWVEGCQTTLDGSSRYCPFCGKESTFYRRGFLKGWNYDPNDPPF